MYLCLIKLKGQVWKKNCPNFLYTLYEAQRKSELSFSNSFLAVFPLLAMQQISASFLKRVCFEKNFLCLADFLQSGALFIPYICKYIF